MLKKVFLILISIVSLWAQDINYGINVGVAAGTINGLDTTNPKTNKKESGVDPGLELGLLIGFDLALIDIEAEANFSFQKYNGFDESALYMFNAPLSARLTILPLVDVKIYFRAGIQYESVLSNKLSDNLEFKTTSGSSILYGIGGILETEGLPSLMFELRIMYPNYEIFTSGKQETDIFSLSESYVEDKKLTQANLRVTILF